MKIDQHIGSRARGLRLEKGLPAERVAIAISFTLENYLALEAGRFPIRAATIVDLAIFFDVSVSHFLHGYVLATTDGSGKWTRG